MKIKRICIYQEFHCTGANCRANCCKGWQVPLEKEICEKYLAEKGKIGWLPGLSVKRNGGQAVFRSVLGRCPHLGKDHLCRLQKAYGEEYMARICRLFPRQLCHFGPFCEESLYLACPETARLFWERAERGEHFPFLEIEGEVSYGLTTTNDDGVFLETLLAAREELIHSLGEGRMRYDSLALLNYGLDAQNACLDGKDCPAPRLYQDEEGERLCLGSAALDQLFYNGFYHPYLRILSPLLHRLCVKYRNEIALPGKGSRKAAERRLASLREGLLQKIPEWELVMNRYLEYYLQTDFLNIFEDYSFLKCLGFGMAKIQMLEVLTALYAQEKEKVTAQEIAQIIAVYERRAPQIRGALADLLSDFCKERGRDDCKK